jgi:hypothetical protein
MVRWPLFVQSMKENFRTPITHGDVLWCIGIVLVMRLLF